MVVCVVQRAQPAKSLTWAPRALPSTRQLDLGIPAMTRCCDELDVCYGTCGANKNDCDSEFRLCLRSICKDINKSLGFASEVKGGF